MHAINTGGASAGRAAASGAARPPAVAAAPPPAPPTPPPSLARRRRLANRTTSGSDPALAAPFERARLHRARALPMGSDPNSSNKNEALDDIIARNRIAPPSSAAAGPAPTPPPRLPPGVTALSPGQKVGPAGRYTVLEVLGAGANAVAYRASDSQGGGREVALKALSLKSLRDWKQLDLFKREAETLRALSHPSIPALLDYFEEDSPDDRAFYIAQEAVPKGCATLAEMVSPPGAAAALGRPTDAEVLRVARELLGTLDYLSGLRPPVVHRDIKPENIVIEGGRWGGKVYLVDFGGSVAAASSSSSSGPEVLSGGSAAPPPLGSTIVGTYGYMAPEQFRGEASPASDLYALGATLLFLATGRAPSSFPQDGRMRVDLSAASRSVGPEVAELLDGLLEPLPEDRMTAAEALQVASGRQRKAARRRAGGASRQQQQQQQQQPRKQQQLEQMMVRLPDGSLLPVTAVPAGRAALAQQQRGAYGGDSLARGARKPAGTRVRLQRTPGRLDVEIPPEGLGGQSVGAGLFALAWNGFVAFWTFSALASGGVLFALFSAPFWFAGAQLAQQALGGAFTRERLALGRRRFRLAQELATADPRSGAARFLEKAASGAGGGGAGAREVEGELEDLVGARVVTTMVVNGVPRTAIELVEGVRKHRFGEALDPSEQRWIVAEVDSFLEERRGAPVMERDFPAADPAEVVVEDDYLDGSGGALSGGGFFGGGRGADDPFTAGRGVRDDPFMDRDDRFWGDRR